MAVKKRFKVRVRAKVRNRLLRRGGAVAGVALGLLLASWVFSAGIKASRTFLDGRFFAFIPRSFEIDCPSQAAVVSLRAVADKAGKSRLSAGRCAELEREIKRSHPGLASVKVSRNFITGKAAIKAVPEEIVSAVLAAGATSYLGVTGRLMSQRLSGTGSYPFSVELAGAPSRAPELAAFLSALNPLADLFYSRPRVFSCDGRSWECTLKLEDGTTVLWGEFEFTRLKVLRLNEVMRDASRKTGPPLHADLRSFREGKIFISAAK